MISFPAWGKFKGRLQGFQKNKKKSYLQKVICKLGSLQHWNAERDFRRI